MPRPRKNRRVGRRPVAEGMEHQQAAEMMDISRPTFSRVLAEARRTMATAMANGWAIRIEGGSYEISPYPETDVVGRRGHRGGRRR